MRKLDGKQSMRLVKAIGLAAAVMGGAEAIVCGFVWVMLHVNFWMGIGILGAIVFIYVVAMIYSMELAEGSTKS